MANKFIPNVNIQQNRTIIEHGNVKLTNNALYYENSVLQISNIARVWIGKFNPESLPSWPFVLIGLGIFMALIGMSIDGVTPFVIFALGVGLGIYGGYSLHNLQKSRKEKYGIQIEMNSSFIIVFSSPDREFLIKIMDSIANDFSGRHDIQTVISMEDRSINVMNNSGVVSSGNDSFIKVNT